MQHLHRILCSLLVLPLVGSSFAGEPPSAEDDPNNAPSIAWFLQ